MSVQMTDAERERFVALSKKREDKGGELSEGDEEYEWEELASLRRLEIEQMTPTPGCCEASRMHPTAFFSLGYGKAGEDPGKWVVAVHRELERTASAKRRTGKRYDGKEGWTIEYHDFGRAPEPKFCPYCGTLLPEMRLKSPIPEGLRDGRSGNYCETCDERLESCLCDPPEAAYEIIPQSKNYLFALRTTMDASIRDADAELSRVTSAKRIAEIWTTLDKLETLAEARLRLALAYVEQPSLVSTPPWLEAATSAISSIPRFQAIEAALRSASNLVRAFLAIHPEAAADVELTHDDCVAIRWDDKAGLRFVVSRPMLRWPAVNARSYRHTNLDSPALECRYARLAEELLVMPYEKR